MFAKGTTWKELSAIQKLGASLLILFMSPLILFLVGVWLCFVPGMTSAWGISKLLGNQVKDHESFVFIFGVIINLFFYVPLIVILIRLAA